MNRTVMNRTVTTCALAAALLATASVAALSMNSSAAPATAPATAPETNVAASNAYQFDTVHSSLIFSIKHAGVANFYGRFNQFSGELTWDESDAANSSIKLSIPVEGVDTANERRDAHLRSPDFFSAAEFPTVDFESTSIEKSGDVYNVTGNLSMHGVTKPITVELRQTGTTTHRSGRQLIGLESKFTIKRSDFNMNYGIEGGGLSDEVNLIFSFEALQAAQ